MTVAECAELETVFDRAKDDPQIGALVHSGRKFDAPPSSQMVVERRTFVGAKIFQTPRDGSYGFGELVVAGEGAPKVC